MNKIIISGFGDPNVNGIYTQFGTSSGYPSYVKDNTYFLIYYPSLMPWSNDYGYYICVLYSTNSSILILQPKYKKHSTDPLDTTVTWTSLKASYTGEYNIGTVIEEK